MRGTTRPDRWGYKAVAAAPLPSQTAVAPPPRTGDRAIKYEHLFAPPGVRSHLHLAFSHKSGILSFGAVSTDASEHLVWHPITPNGDPNGLQ